MALTKPKLSQNIDTDISVFSDPILVLHQGSSLADVDVGFLMNRSNGLTANAAVIWQESSKSFVHILTTSSGVADANLTVQSYANVSVGNVLLINNAGIYVDGTIGSAGQVLASDGSKTFWAPPGGFTGGTVANPSVFQSNLVISNTTPSTSNVTGALVVAGGVGIAGNVYANVYYIMNSIRWAGNGAVFESGGTPGGSNTNIQYNNAGVFAGASNFTYTAASGNVVVGTSTPSTSTTTGALVVGGGTGIAGNLYVGSTATQSILLNSYPLWSANSVRQTPRWTTSSTTPVGSILGDMWYDSSTDILYEYINDGTNNIWVDVSSAFSNNFVILSGVTVTATGNAQATNTTTGDLQVTGGASINTGNLYIGGSGGRSITATGNVVITGTASTSTTSGALVVAGGVGVSGNLNVGSGTSGYKATFASPGAGTSGVMFINAALNSSGNGLIISSTTRTVADNAVPMLHLIARDGTVALSTTVQGNTVIGSTTASTSTTTGALVVNGGAGIAGNIELGGDLEFNGTGNRIRGDFSNATIANRAMFQTSTANSPTNVYAIPNGSGTTASFSVSNSNDPNNASIGQLVQLSTELRIQNVITGTGTYLPMTFYTGGSERVKIDASTGNVVIVPTTTSTSTTTGALVVRGGAGFAANIFTAGWIIPSSNVSQNLGTTTSWWNLIYGRSVQAQYADLAENYEGDELYTPATVVVFGGSKEITVSNISHDARIAGVVSTNPAYLMNAINTGTPVALTGKVPCKVKGPISKGSILVNSDIDGVAMKLDMANYQPGCVIGKSLEDILDDSVQIVNIAVGRF